MTFKRDMNGKRLVVTGGNGFVGSHLVDLLLKTNDSEIVIPVSQQHCGEPFRIQQLKERNPKEAKRLKVVPLDLSFPVTEYDKKRLGRADMIFHVAAGSNVDTSQEQPVEFWRNNVMLQSTILELAREWDVELFLHQGTDEQNGASAPGQFFTEHEPSNGSNIYAASKCAQLSLTMADWRSFGLPAIATKTMNLISPVFLQAPDKFIPKVVNAAFTGKEIEIHSSPDGKVSGTRCWIDVRDWAAGWLYIAENLAPAMYRDGAEVLDQYNLVGPEVSNLNMALMVSDIVGRELNYKMVDAHSSRPGHDRSYLMSNVILKQKGWDVSIPIEKTLQDIVQSAYDNPEWYGI